MALIVQKFGGTSVGDPERIRRVARRVAATAEGGNSVAVVVSAMGHTTDELVDLAKAVSDDPNPRELDMLLTAGEQISIALLSMAHGFRSERRFIGMSAVGPDRDRVRCRPGRRGRSRWPGVPGRGPVRQAQR